MHLRSTLAMHRIETGRKGKLHDLRDNASRLGLRAVEDPGGGLQTLCGLGMGLITDTGTDPGDGVRFPGWRQAGLAAAPE